MQEIILPTVEVPQTGLTDWFYEELEKDGLGFLVKN